MIAAKCAAAYSCTPWAFRWIVSAYRGASTRESGCLVPDQHADEADGAQGHEDTDENGGTAPQPEPAEQIHERRQNEGQDHRERDWNQNVLRDIERSDDDGGDGECEETPDLGSGSGRELHRARSGKSRRSANSSELSSCAFTTGRQQAQCRWVNAIAYRPEPGHRPALPGCFDEAAEVETADWAERNRSSRRERFT